MKNTNSQRPPRTVTRNLMWVSFWGFLIAILMLIFIYLGNVSALATIPVNLHSVNEADYSNDEYNSISRLSFQIIKSILSDLDPQADDIPDRLTQIIIELQTPVITSTPPPLIQSTATATGISAGSSTPSSSQTITPPSDSTITSTPSGTITTTGTQMVSATPTGISSPITTTSQPTQVTSQTPTNTSTPTPQPTQVSSPTSPATPTASPQPTSSCIATDPIWGFVLSVDPLDGATGVILADKVNIIFVQSMGSSSINASTILVIDPGGPVAGTVQYITGIKTARFNPLGGWVNLTSYTVRITSQVQNTCGDFQNITVETQFTTE